MASTKQSPQELLDALETVMVNIFRLCQSLYALSKDERQVMIEGKVDDLISLAQKKETILTEMETNESQRGELTAQLAAACGMEEEPKILSDLLPTLKGMDTEQIVRLQQGILALQAEIRELNNGNYALATLNLDRLEAVQGYILSLFTPTNLYRPAVKMPRVEPPASWGMDHRA